MGGALLASIGRRSTALASGTLFSCYVIRGSPPLATGWGLQWIALLYRHSSRKCAAPRRLSPKPKKESHRPRLNLPRARASSPLSRPGHLLQSVATRDGWPPAKRPMLGASSSVSTLAGRWRHARHSRQGSVGAQRRRKSAVVHHRPSRGRTMHSSGLRGSRVDA